MSDPRELIAIRIGDNYGIEANFSPWFFVSLAVGLIVVWLMQKALQRRYPKWHPVKMELELGGIGKVEIAPRHEVVRLAHQAWVEFSTRKAGVPFDEGHDVIIEVYNSWYELFRQVRSITKEVPAELIRDDADSKKLVELLVTALNEGLRPHLTEWQAKFRRWYLIADRETENAGKSPQEIQRQYPEYQKLVTSVKKVNHDLVQYTDFLRKLAQGE